MPSFAGAFAIYQVEIPRIYEKAAALAEDKNGVPAQYRIDKEHPASEYAEVPEGYRDDALSLFFTRYPLHQEPSGEESLRGKAQDEYEIIRAPSC